MPWSQAAIHRETADAATLVIRPSHGWIGHRPGQWVRIGVDIEGLRHWRTYSLSGPPGRPDGRITTMVKAASEGFVSRYLVRHAAPGTIVEVARPGGEFVLPEPPPSRLLFLTAGSGITPVRAMLYGLLTGPATRDAAEPRVSPADLRRAEMPSAAGCPMWSCCTRRPRQKTSSSVRNCVPWRRGLRICGCMSGTREPGAVSGRPTCRTCARTGPNVARGSAGRQGCSKKPPGSTGPGWKIGCMSSTSARPRRRAGAKAAGSGSPRAAGRPTAARRC
jgi:hypothetical protein